MFRGFMNGVATFFGYDAVKETKARRSIDVRHGAEDRILNQSDRSRLNSAAFDLRRNFPTFGWAVRKHLDYVSRFKFQARTGNDALDDKLKKLIEIQCRSYNCDSAGKHPFSKMIRILEAMSVLSGDVGLMKLNNMRLQPVEGDRVRNFTNYPSDFPRRNDLSEWCHGIKKNDAGRHLAYAVHKRTTYGGFQFERIVPASNMVWHGKYERFDQTRGISPIAAAVNSFRDCYEASEYALNKMKVSQLMALAFFLKDKDADDDDVNPEVDQDDEKADGEDDEPFKYDFDRNGPIQVDLKDGDKMEVVESKTPSMEFQSFNQFHIMSGLKALDIPFSFFDESFTNFYGSRGAAVQYLRSCKDKHESLQEVLRMITVWWISYWIVTGMLKLPPRYTIEDVNFAWIPEGVPWWDQSKEINGDMLAIRAGLNTPQNICQEKGTGDWYENIDEIAHALQYARERGVALSFDLPPIQVVDPEEVSNAKH